MGFVFNIMLSLLWGGILSVVLILLLYVLMCMLFSSYRLTLWNIIAMLVLWIFLFAQSTMMVGAMYAKGYVDDVQSLVSSVVKHAEGAFDQYSGEEQIDRIKEAIDEKLPIASSYIDEIDIDSVVDGNYDLAIGVANVMKSHINYYILRRVLWMLGFMVVGGVVLANMRPRPVYMPTDMSYYS